ARRLDARRRGGARGRRRGGRLARPARRRLEPRLFAQRGDRLERAAAQLRGRAGERDEALVLADRVVAAGEALVAARDVVDELGLGADRERLLEERDRGLVLARAVVLHRAVDELG